MWSVIDFIFILRMCIDSVLIFQDKLSVWKSLEGLVENQCGVFHRHGHFVLWGIHCDWSAWFPHVPHVPGANYVGTSLQGADHISQTIERWLPPLWWGMLPEHVYFPHPM